MANVAIYDIANNKVGDMELNDSIFGVEMNAGLLHQAVLMQLAAQRLGTHATKTRSINDRLNGSSTQRVNRGHSEITQGRRDNQR